MRRSTFLAAMAVVLAAPAALAQGYPARPIRMVVPFPAGAATDLAARVIGQRTLTDDSSVEMLLLDGDGNLQVRSSATDRQDPNRIKREENWFKWIADIKKFSEGRPGAAGTTGGGSNPFEGN